MPRSVDHETRRSEIADAVLTLVARAGTEAVSLRSVAAEAGISMGRVQHYFASKEALLLHALDRSHRRMERRIEERAVAAGGSERDALATILDELLGEHPETRDAIRIHAAFASREVDERARAILTDGDEEILALAVRVVADAGSPDPGTDGYALVALAGGLGNDVVLHGAPIERARRTLRAVLDRLAPPR
ncbi:TetR/AcrR family transcriptional regulator [Pseudonocardia parietis]|uniref:AcrR family transcriptional regulator n=1 Tax=Pseudonocardia parietis TaxID=570936 RepID=A0ABS4W5M7_9PSEU|nr:TetR/AcrR family transcriptional regulator [Pseudonocardia parietis]MBP2370914.1 AcrR family transcriptional regulator [Pseudonocardia parietis]